MIIGLNGRKQVGKDTVGAYLVRHYGFERRSFADPLKRSMAALFNIPVGELEVLKNHPEVQLQTTYCGTLASEMDGTIDTPLVSFNFRQLLQRYGEESHRQVLDPDIWVNYTLPLDLEYPGQIGIVVTDVRYRNEAERIKGLKGYVVNIQRPTEGEADPHTSEQPLPLNLIDYVLSNEGNMKELYTNIEVMMAHLKREADGNI